MRVFMHYILAALLCISAHVAAYSPSARDVRLVSNHVANDHLWIKENGTATKQLRILTNTVKDAFAHGLNPADYDAAFLQSILEKNNTDISIPETNKRITKAALKYAHDLHLGRIKPSTLPSMHMKARRENIPLLLAKALEPGEDFASHLRLMAPTQKAYHMLRQELQDRVKYLPKSNPWPVIPAGKKLEQGSSGNRVLWLKQRLAAEGFYRDRSRMEDPTYDEGVAHAVSLFQKRYNLSPDGVAGNRTLDVLNLSKEAYIKAIIANMERWRWVPRDWGDKYIHVNIPAYIIHAVENGKTHFNMRAIVGHTDKETRTAIASTTTSNVTFNPRWNVPQRIAKDSILPVIKKNPNYLNASGYTLRDRATGKRVNPTEIDWTAIDKENFNYSLSQAPGKKNALGQIRFYVDNNSAMHIHDTSLPHLFDNHFRAMSNGCVRAERPYELAEFVLEDKGTPDNIASARKRKNNRIVLPKPVKTYMQYWTVHPDATGNMQFYYDVYGYDKIVAKALKLDTYLPRVLGKDGVKE